ncbi:MAG TPA: FtsX-like permease family protein [Candidatus Binatia bacterium]|nr:FtsX-like permease family protein [Candidatus Binatia bacterium]
MRISTLAFANLNRRKGKTIFLTLGIAIGVGTIVALLSLSNSIQEEIGTQLDRFGANIVVVPQSNNLALDYGGVSVPGVTFDAHQLTNEDVDRIRQIPYHKRLSVIAPKVLSAAQVEGQQVLLAGVDFKNELKLRQWWRVTGKTPEADTDVLVGYEVARALSLIEVSGETAQKTAAGGSHHSTPDEVPFKVVKDEVQLFGIPHKVTGVIAATGGPEDRMIFGDLAHVHKLAGKPDQVNVIEVSALCKGCPVEDIVAQIRDKLPHAKVSAIQQAVKARTEMVGRLTRFSAAVAMVVLVIGALMIFTTMMGAVVERTKEIGVLRAIGFRRTAIIRGLILEVAAISTAGGMLGWVAGLAASWIVLPYFSEGGVGREVNPTLLLGALFGALLIGTLSSIYPAVRAARLDPSEAVRYI